ncbi:MAG TPA: hypothetical protein VFU89_06375, partial [Rhabdochlamydiaceae bacterium]|nr:hypothetical protein [Rhabdochlamydiaceae bacterium]
MTTPTVSSLTPSMANATIGSPKLEATWIAIASPDETPPAKVICSCIAAASLTAKAPPLYTNNLKNREFDKEGPQNLCSEQATIVNRQGASENKNYETNPTQSKTDSSSCLCISEKYDFGKNLLIAETKILKYKTNEARSKFQEVFTHLQETRLPESFYPVRCYLGLALCCPPGNDRRRHALDAHSALQRLFAYTASMTGTDVSLFYSRLRWYLKKLWLLMLEAQTGEIDEIEDKIEECGRHILPIDAFNEMVMEGHELRIAGLKTCREVFKQALALIH